MSRGKYLRLEEAQKQKKLDRFAKEHPSKCDAEKFDKLFKAMASGQPPKKKRTKPKKP